MPVIKSAKKKLRKDRKREKQNNEIKLNFRNAVKEAKKTKTLEKVKTAVTLVDKAVKRGIIHKNKAARIKSRLSKVSKPTPKSKTVQKNIKPAPKAKK
jgi:small subunit ribosomal protein S20